VATVKKARDEYKSKADSITSGMKKAEADADRLDGQIRQLALNYQKTAVQMDHDDIVEALRDLLDSL